MEYQGRTLVPITQLIKKSRILSDLEKMAEPGEEVMIDVKFASYKFKRGRGPDFEKYNVYAVKRVRELETPPRFLTSIDRLVKNGKKTLIYRIN